MQSQCSSNPQRDVGKSIHTKESTRTAVDQIHSVEISQVIHFSAAVTQIQSVTSLKVVTKLIEQRAWKRLEEPSHTTESTEVTRIHRVELTNQFIPPMARDARRIHSVTLPKAFTPLMQSRRHFNVNSDIANSIQTTDAQPPSLKSRA